MFQQTINGILAIIERMVCLPYAPRCGHNMPNTDKIIASFGKGLVETGATYDLYTLSSRKEWGGTQPLDYQPY